MHHQKWMDILFWMKEKEKDGNQNRNRRNLTIYQASKLHKHSWDAHSHDNNLLVDIVQDHGWIRRDTNSSLNQLLN